MRTTSGHHAQKQVPNALCEKFGAPWSYSQYSACHSLTQSLIAARPHAHLALLLAVPSLPRVEPMGRRTQNRVKQKVSCASHWLCVRLVCQRVFKAFPGPPRRCARAAPRSRKSRRCSSSFHRQAYPKSQCNLFCNGPCVCLRKHKEPNEPCEQ